MTRGGVHRRIPRHVRHVHEQRIDRIGIAAPRVGDDHVHHAVNGERRLPGESLVDADRRSVRLDQQILRPRGKAERRAVERRIGRHALAGGLLRRRNRLRKRRLEAKSTRAIDRAEQRLQQMDGAASMKAVAMGGDAAHRVHRDGAADDLVVFAPRPIDPFDVEFDGLLEGRFGEFGGDAADLVGADAASRGDRLRAVALVHAALRHELEDGNRLAPVGKRRIRRPRRARRRRSWRSPGPFRARPRPAVRPPRRARTGRDRARRATG